MSALQSAAFASPGGPKITFSLGMPIPNGFNLVDPTITAIYDTKKVPGVRYLVALTAPVPKPPGNPTYPETSGPPPLPPTAAPSYAISRGGFYIAVPTGARIYLAAGMPIPTGWLPDTGTLPPVPPVPAAQVPAVTQQVIEGSYSGLSKGGYYVMTDAPTFNYTYYPTGQAPAGWTLVTPGLEDPTLLKSPGAYYNSPTGTEVYILSGFSVPKDYTLSRVAAPPKPQPAPVAIPSGWSLTTIFKIVGVVGVAGVAYLGYLAVTNPEGARFFLSRFEELKNLVVDSSQLLVALGVIGAVGFVSYEFIAAYESEGSVAGAIGKLSADVIETMVMAIVDAIEDLAKDLANWVEGEVSKLADAINPF